MKEARIIVVDDEDLVRELLAFYLKSDQRFLVDEAADGFSAVSKTMMKNYNLAILDIAMPRINGLEAMKNMRINCPSMKFIIITGMMGQDLLMACNKLGCCLIRKPIEKKTLLDAVYSTLGIELEAA